MTELIPQSGIYAIPVPVEIKNAHFYRVNNESIMLAWNDVKRPLNPYNLVRVDYYRGDLKDYKWPVIICTTANASEEDAAKFLEFRGYREELEPMYLMYGEDVPTIGTWKDSLSSLLRSLNLNEENYLIIKKEMV